MLQSSLGEKMERKIQIKEYEILDIHIEKEKKVAFLSDIHYVTGFDQNILKQIIYHLKQNKPNFICIGGDIVDNAKEFDDLNNQKILLQLFQQFGNIATTLIIFGNHDFINYENKKRSFHWNKEWIQKINQLQNVHLLHNSNYETKYINFIGYTQSLNYYHSVLKRGKYDDNEQILIQELNQFLPKWICFDKCNILLCHSPIKILQDNTISNVDLLKEIRLILTGHMHNGLVPNCLEKIFPNNYGFLYPNKQLLPKVARGIIEKKIKDSTISLIVSGGITKIQNCAPKIIQPINQLYPASIEYIKIKRPTF